MKQHAYQYNPVADLDEEVLLLLKSGVPICERPYLRLAQSIALGEMALILRIQLLIKERRLQNNYIRPHIHKPLLTQHNRIISHWDSQLIRLLRKGLPLSSRPFHILAKQTDLSIDEVLFRVHRLHHQGYIEKISPVV